MLIYRIIHVKNLEYILNQGKIVCPNHAESNPDYINIGNNTIISRRSRKQIPGLGNQSFLDYVAFYFGPRSIMLYNICTGFDVQKVSQPDIIYLVYNINNITSNGYNFFFTDGQGANIPVTQVFHSLDDLGKVDLDAAYARDFSSHACQNDPDLKRKKHAEFHIKEELNVNHLHNITVFNENARNYIVDLLKKYNILLNVEIDKSYYF